MKVLIHELAHAYTHLGSDIDGMTWRDDDFRAAEKPVVEGVAQYYTWCVLESISELHEARHAYEELVPRQPEAYQVHLPWTRRSDRERVRKAMLATRREGWRALQEFAVSLGRGLG
ncbi:hypothetical protein OAG62_00480 [bacterium]|nr:hypothetical protein [bacterium]